MDTHNLYLRTLFEGGIVGFLVLMAIWVGLLSTAFALWRRAEDRLDERVGVGLFVAGLGLMVSNVFGDRFTHQALIAQVWTIAGVGARLRAADAGREPLADEEDLPEEDAEELDAAERDGQPVAGVSRLDG